MTIHYSIYTTKNTHIMHFTLIVAMQDYESLDDIMYPFCEDTTGEEYCVGEVSEEQKRTMLDYYSSQRLGSSERYATFEECYRENGEDWNGNAFRRDDDGVWREYSDHNPDAEYDWWEIGGRWPGRLRLKDGVEQPPSVNFSWGWSKEEQEKFHKENPRSSDIARLSEVDNLDELTSYSLLIDGEWICVDGKVGDYLKGLDGDPMLVCIDYHY